MIKYQSGIDEGQVSSMDPPSRSGSTMNLTGEKYTSGNGRLLLILVVVCVVIGMIAVIVAAVSLSRPTYTDHTHSTQAGHNASDHTHNAVDDGTGTHTHVDGTSHTHTGNTDLTHTHDGTTHTHSPTGEKIWTVQLGHDFGAHSYLDSRGFIAGFDQDIVTTVCAAAAIDCRTIWDPYTNCVKSEPGQHSMGGIGLHGRYYDACTGWFVTVSRQHFFKFSTSFAAKDPTHFYIKAGGSFDETDMIGKKIGFLDGWAHDEKCLARQSGIKNNVLAVTQVVHYNTTDELAQAIRAGDVAAGFVGELEVEAKVGLDEMPTVYSCMLSGPAMMTRKDNDFVTYFNTGLKKIFQNGYYKTLCQKNHAPFGTVRCL